MDFVCDAGAEPLPGYRLLSRVGRGGFGEVWKCEAPGGLHKAIKFVAASPGLGDGEAMRQEQAALARLRTIRHPFLLSVERVEVVRGGMIVVMELADENLRDVFENFRAAGEPGIPRDLLLDYLDEAAEALDVLEWQHGLIHLDVKPDNVFLVADHAKVGDFGLLTALPESGRNSTFHEGGFTPAYAAPELWAGKASRRSDQYSLAVTYYELRTGGAVFDGANARQLMLQHATKPPSLALLPAAERWAVERALAKAPAERFACCRDFVHALRTGQEPPASPPTARLRSTVRLRRPAAPTAPTLERRIAELIGAGSGPPRSSDLTPHPAGVRRRYVSQHLRGVLRLRLDGFQKFWGGELAEDGADRVLYRVALPQSFRSRYVAVTPALTVEVRLELPCLGAGALSEVVAEVRPAEGCGEAERQMAREIGPLLLASLQNTLGLIEDRRGSGRVGWTAPLIAWPVWPDEGRVGEPIHCRGKDVSLSGAGFLSPVEPPSAMLRLRLAAQGRPAIDALARVIRVQGGPDGFDVGAQFCEAADPNTLPALEISPVF
jgi:hypothetical protein